jgi:hypothetical protein
MKIKRLAVEAAIGMLIVGCAMQSTPSQSPEPTESPSETESPAPARTASPRPTPTPAATAVGASEGSARVGAGMRLAIQRSSRPVGPSRPSTMVIRR